MMDAARVIRMLHAALVIGLALVGLVFVVLLRVAGMSFGFGPQLGRVIAIPALGFLVLAWLFARRRVPARPLAQLPNDYWSANDVRGAAIVLWAMVEAPGMISWIGYLLTGDVAPAAVAILAIVTLLALRPARLEGAAAQV